MTFLDPDRFPATNSGPAGRSVRDLWPYGLLAGSVFGSLWILVQVLRWMGPFADITPLSRALVVALLAVLSCFLATVVYFYRGLSGNDHGPSDERDAGRGETVGTPGDGSRLSFDRDPSTEDDTEVLRGACLSVGVGRDDLDLPALISGAERRMEFIGLSLAPLTNETCIKALERVVVEDDVNVRVLLVNPLSVNCWKRDEGLYPGIPYLPENVVDSISVFRSLKRHLQAENPQYASNLQVRVYSDVPTLSGFFVDDRANLSHYLKHRTGMGAPNFDVTLTEETPRELREVVEEHRTHFERVFEDAVSIESPDLPAELVELADAEIADVEAAKRSDVLEEIGDNGSGGDHR